MSPVQTVSPHGTGPARPASAVMAVVPARRARRPAALAVHQNAALAYPVLQAGTAKLRKLLAQCLVQPFAYLYLRSGEVHRYSV